MHDEPPSALFTWACILGSILAPTFVFLNSTMSSSVPSSQLFLALLALTVMAVIGIVLGFCVRPNSSSAGMAVYGSPFVTVLIYLALFGGWDVLVDETNVLSNVGSLMMMAFVLIFFSIPTAGKVRATHWFRER